MRQYFAASRSGNFFSFSNEDNHHIVNVLRSENNKTVLVNHLNKSYLCHLIINDKSVVAEIDKEINLNNELEKEVKLIYGLVKADKFEFVIQKASELGVSSIIPFNAKRSIKVVEKQKEQSKLERWNKIAYEACKQSNRNKIVNVEKIASLNDLLNYKSDLNILAYEEESKNDASKLFSLLKGHFKNVTIIVGPEGGFAKEEVDFLLKNGFISVSLGKRILRSETAPIYLLSVIGFMQERGSENE